MVTTVRPRVRPLSEVLDLRSGPGVVEVLPGARLGVVSLVEDLGEMTDRLAGLGVKHAENVSKAMN
jgi:hypothetical protein